MRTFFIILLGLSIQACATVVAAKKPEVAIQNPSEVVTKEASNSIKNKPLQVFKTQESIAEIDPETLKVTYKKGSDLKEVVDAVVKAWASAMNEARKELQNCQAQTQKK